MPRGKAGKGYSAIRGIAYQLDVSVAHMLCTISFSVLSFQLPPSNCAPGRYTARVRVRLVYSDLPTRVVTVTSREPGNSGNGADADTLPKEGGRVSIRDSPHILIWVAPSRSASHPSLRGGPTMLRGGSQGPRYETVSHIRGAPVPCCRSSFCSAQGPRN